jgi:DNA repair exonuclease SbcCD ATPase subunit
MRINIKQIHLLNFLSVGNKWVTVDFRKGLYRITGENLDNNTKNGVGKSALFIDGLIFALFGKPVRKINIPDIPNTINGKKKCEVKIEFEVNGNHYMIHRGINPSFLLLNINGENELQDSTKKITQKRINDIIGADFNTFTQILIMSSSYSAPFLDLDNNKKREIIENILGVSILGLIGETAKKEQYDLNTEFKVTTREYEISMSNFKTTKNNIKKLMKKSKEFENTKNQKINELTISLDSLKNTIKELKDKLINEEEKNKDKLKWEKFKEKTHNKKTTIEGEIIQLEKDIKSISTKITNLEKSPICPLCNTETKEDHVQNHLNELKQTVINHKKIVTDNKSVIIDLSDKLEQIKKKINDINEEVHQSILNNQKINHLEESISDKENELDQQINSINHFDEMIDIDNLKSIKQTLESMEVLIKDMEERLVYFDYIRRLMSDDGIKNYIIRKILRFWNVKVNSYLQDLNADFSVLFNDMLDVVIKSRHRDELGYHNFSGGERARLDIAILMSLLDLSKMQNSIDLNVMILDEVLDGAIDAVGREDVLTLLKNKSINEDKSIYVISHSDSLPVHLFTKEILVIKKNGFTSLK